MKYLFLILFSAFALFAGCSKEEGKEPVANGKPDYNFDSTDLKTAAIDNPNQPFTLAYKFEKGKEYIYRITSLTKEVSEIKGDTSINQTVDQNLAYIIKVVPVEISNEDMELQCTVTNARVNATTPNEKFYYETGISKDSASLMRFSDYEALVNNPFNFTVTKNGEILEVFKTDKIVNKYLSINDADTISGEQKNQIKQRFIESNLKPLVGQLFRQVPEKQLAKDSTWQRDQNPSQIMVFVMKNTEKFKVTNLEEFKGDKVAEVDLGFNTTFEGKNQVSQGGVNYNFTTPVTSAHGTIFFNVDEGYLLKSVVKTSMIVNIKASGPGPRGVQSSSKSQRIENTNVIELIN